MVIGMDRTPKGRIWACWVGGGDNQDGFFVAATSDDDGLTSRSRGSRSTRPIRPAR